MRLFLTVFAILLLVQVAHAQSVNAPDLTVGDTWKRSHGLEVKVVKVEGRVPGEKGYVLH